MLDTYTRTLALGLILSGLSIHGEGSPAENQLEPPSSRSPSAQQQQQPRPFCQTLKAAQPGGSLSAIGRT